jgi:hypothetical protein
MIAAYKERRILVASRLVLRERHERLSAGMKNVK